MARDSFILGLDLGGTKIAAGVVTPAGRLLSRVRVPTPAAGVRRDVAAMFDAAQAAVGSARVSWGQIRAVGVGVPGAFDPVKKTVWAPNLPGWRKVPLGEILRKALRRPVFVEGDRNVQALAEAWLAHPSARNLVFLTVGTGIGAGIIADGRLVPGSRGVAGAVGWLVTDREWRREYARVGCLEHWASGSAVARRAEEVLPTPASGPLRGLVKKHGGITAEVVTQAARRGDRAARHVLEEVGDALGRGVASLIAVLNPEVVVLGGGLAGAGNLILMPLRRAVERWGQPLARRQAKIVLSRIREDAGVLGAARYAFLRMED
jgi:glucokinase